MQQVCGQVFSCCICCHTIFFCDRATLFALLSRETESRDKKNQNKTWICVIIINHLILRLSLIYKPIPAFLFRGSHFYFAFYTGNVFACPQTCRLPLTTWTTKKNEVLIWWFAHILCGLKTVLNHIPINENTVLQTGSSASGSLFKNVVHFAQRAGEICGKQEIQCDVSAQAWPHTGWNVITFRLGWLCVISFTRNLPAGGRTVDPSHPRLWSVLQREPSRVARNARRGLMGGFVRCIALCPSRGWGLNIWKFSSSGEYAQFGVIQRSVSFLQPKVWFQQTEAMRSCGSATSAPAQRSPFSYDETLRWWYRLLITRRLAAASRPGSSGVLTAFSGCHDVCRGRWGKAFLPCLNRNPCDICGRTTLQRMSTSGWTTLPLLSVCRRSTAWLLSSGRIP